MTIIETRRGMRGTVGGGVWAPLPIRGGDDYLDRINAEADALYPTEERRIRQAADSARQALAKLLRPDGQPLYGAEETTDRTRAILATFDETVSEISQDLDNAIVKAEHELQVLDAAEADPWGNLSTEAQAQAAARREFLREDIASQSPDDLLRLARGALATKDPATLYLLGRYLPARIESLPIGQARVDLHELTLDIRAALAVPHAAEKRSKATMRVERGKFLKGRPERLRSELDGSHELMLSSMRQRFSI
jgi:hypothetical protein